MLAPEPESPMMNGVYSLCPTSEQRPLSTQDLAYPWGFYSDFLASWRQHDIGPHFIQIGQLIRSPVTEVQSFEHQMESKPYTVKGIHHHHIHQNPEQEDRKTSEVKVF